MILVVSRGQRPPPVLEGMCSVLLSSFESEKSLLPVLITQGVNVMISASRTNVTSVLVSFSFRTLEVVVRSFVFYCSLSFWQVTTPSLFCLFKGK